MKFVTSSMYCGYCDADNSDYSDADSDAEMMLMRINPAKFISSSR